MKIIQVVYSLCSGGAERFVVSLSNALYDMGHEVEVCMLLEAKDEHLQFNRHLLNPDIPVHSMGFSRGFTLRKAVLTMKYIASQQPDIVHCHLNVIPYIMPLAIVKRSIRFFHTLHSVASNTATTSQYRLNKFFYKHEIIRPVAISDRCNKSYQNYYHLDNASTIDNGCDNAKPTKLFQQVKEEVSSYKRDENTRVYVHVAHFSDLKNQDLLVDSFNQLAQEGENIVLLIIGAGFDTPEGMILKQKSCSSIKYLGLKSNVDDYLFNADALCLSSKVEGLPMTIIEAMSAGIPSICTAVGGIPDVIQDSVNGFLSKELTVTSYMGAISRSQKTPINPTVLKQCYHGNYSMVRCAQKYCALYSQKSQRGGKR